eukprot:6109632-Prymnesium_polylepis.2
MEAARLLRRRVHGASEKCFHRGWRSEMMKRDGRGARWPIDVVCSVVHVLLHAVLMEGSTIDDRQPGSPFQGKGDDGVLAAVSDVVRLLQKARVLSTHKLRERRDRGKRQAVAGPTPSMAEICQGASVPVQERIPGPACRILGPTRRHPEDRRL